MANRQARQDRVTASELEPYIVHNVHETGVGIGVGAYGSVAEVEIPGALVAAKKLHPQLVKFGSPEQVLKWITDFVAECRLMSQLRHPHIVQFLGVCYLPGSQLPVLLMEKLQTSLDNLLETNPNIPINIKVFLLTGTGRGVVYLHSRTPSIAHRDLTAKNILIDSGLTAKIADLGVATMVNIQPGQLAATMTQAPGNVLYMPPEAIQEERTSRYSTAIDIFSFGVITLFTLTQTFPKNLKPPTYRDPATRRVVGRTEIERREEYIQLMITALNDSHPLVKLTLNCLEYDHEDRPSAVEVLRRLKEFGKTIPQNCTETKLELICRISGIEEQLAEKDQTLTEKEAQNEALQAVIVTKQARIDCLQAENRKQIHVLQELTTLQQQQLEVQRREIDELSSQLRRTLEKGVHQPQRSGWKEAPVVKPRKKTSSLPTPSITFNWRRCKDTPQNMQVYRQPVALNGKLYSSGESRTRTILEYKPLRDEWSDLPPPPVDSFTVSNLRTQLWVVGGFEKSTRKTTDTILIFDDRSRQWIKSLPALPKKVGWPAVIGYQDHLVVIGGLKSKYIDSAVPDVNILDTNSNKWITAESIPIADDYKSVLIEETVFLVGQLTRTVLQAHVPTLMSQAKSGAWESLPNAQLYNSSPIKVANTLSTLGGKRDTGNFSEPRTSIYLFNSTKKQWIQVGHLPIPMFDCRCIELSGQLFVLGGRKGSFVDDYLDVVYTAEVCH